MGENTWPSGRLPVSPVVSNKYELDNRGTKTWNFNNLINRNVKFSLYTKESMRKVHMMTGSPREEEDTCTDYDNRNQQTPGGFKVSCSQILPTPAGSEHQIRNEFNCIGDSIRIFSSFFLILYPDCSRYKGPYHRLSA